jgi:hypothetical protein
MNLQKQNYRAWLIDANDFPLSGTLPDKIKFLIGYGVLAPSQHNTQPWIFHLHGEVLSIMPDLAKRLHIGDPDDVGLYLSLGTCIENIVLAANSFDLDVVVTMKHPHEAVLTFRQARQKSKINYLQAITTRYTDKLPYIDGSIPATLREFLEATQTSQTAQCHTVMKGEKFDQIVDLHMQASAAWAGNPAFVHELITFLRSNDTRATDGMPGFVIGLSRSRSILLRVLLKKKPALFMKAVANDKVLLKGAPMVVVWSVKQRDWQSYVECGRLVERFWINAVLQGIVGHPLFAAITDTVTRTQLAEVLGTENQPVFLMRFGHARPHEPIRTPRGVVH